MSKFNFTDKLGVEWDLSLDLASAEAIDSADFKAVTDVEFVFLTPDRDFFAELFANKRLAAAIAYVVIKQTQLNKLQKDIEAASATSDEEYQVLFVRRLNGPALRDMHRAVLEAVADFFPEMQTVLSNLLKKMDKVNLRLEKELTEMDQDLEAHLDQELDKALAEAKSSLPKLREKLRGETSTAP